MQPQSSVQVPRFLSVLVFCERGQKIGTEVMKWAGWLQDQQKCQDFNNNKSPRQLLSEGGILPEFVNPARVDWKEWAAWQALVPVMTTLRAPLSASGGNKMFHWALWEPPFLMNVTLSVGGGQVQWVRQFLVADKLLKVELQKFWKGKFNLSFLRAESMAKWHPWPG